MEKQKKNNIHRKIHQNNKLNLEKKNSRKKREREKHEQIGIERLENETKKKFIRKREVKATGMSLWMMIFVHYWRDYQLIDVSRSMVKKMLNTIVVDESMKSVSSVQQESAPPQLKLSSMTKEITIVRIVELWIHLVYNRGAFLQVPTGLDPRRRHHYHHFLL